jgi:hypothetical protein
MSAGIAFVVIHLLLVCDRLPVWVG